MTLLTDPAQIDAEPAVHVLVIAVGRYPFLKDGDADQRLPEHGELGQLASPVPSGEALVDWLKSEFKPHSAPLKSIEVLSSPGGNFTDWNGAHVEVAPPTMANVRRTVKEWAARGDTSPNSVLMFYFCGHGLSNGEVHSLLLENFGDDADDPFNTGAIDIVAMMDGTRGKKATQQLFFLDACRSFKNSAFKKYGEARGQPIINGAALARLDVVEQAALWASKLGALAYGIPGKPSVFTSAMLHAMKGAGALQDEVDGSWVIAPEFLRLGINFIIQRMPGAPPEQYATLDRMAKNIKIHSLPGDPTVPVAVLCKPRERTRFAAFACSSGESRPVGAADPWHLDLGMDLYSFEADFEDIGKKSKKATPHPPYAIVSFDANP
nr:caspase family protein [Massilia eburnea]